MCGAKTGNTKEIGKTIRCTVRELPSGLTADDTKVSI